MNLNREIAVEKFIQALISHARNGIIHDNISILEKGPPGRQPPEDKVILHQWFQQLDNQAQNYVGEIIKEAVDSTLFSTLVIIDGAAGRPIQGRLSDFALYLQIYSDEDTELQDSPQVRIRLNPKQALEDLHDIFRWTIEDTPGK